VSGRPATVAEGFPDKIAKAEYEGRNLVNHSFRQAVLLILIWMLAYSVIRIIVNCVTKRRVQTAAGN